MRYIIDISSQEDFSADTVRLVDRSGADQPNPSDTVVRHNLTSEGTVTGARQYFRFTATTLGPSNQAGNYLLGMMKIQVMCEDQDIALLRPVTVDSVLGIQGRQEIPRYLLFDIGVTDTASITRELRPMGETQTTNNPDNIIKSDSWQPPKLGATTPVSGVTLLDSGPLLDGFKNNLGYLLSNTLGSLDKLGNDFLNRAGKTPLNQTEYPSGYWDGYPGSNAARFLMGAANALRWTNDTDLQSRVTALVDIIQECSDEQGDVMGFAKNETFEHQNAAYGRSWLTHGLLTVGYQGDQRGFDLLRNYYDWFNSFELLDRMMHGSVQGGQGVIGSTSVGASPIGKPEDIYVVQQYFQENYWRDGLAQGDAEMLWQYPYDHPHTYLTTSLEPYFDMYLLTGDQQYYDMVQGYWKLFHDHWINIGGATSIIEYGEYPPDSQNLNDAGELCGSSFWIRVNQRFHWLNPTTEVYTAEIEKSLYNVVLANQFNDTGMVYHAHLTGTKDLSPPWGGLSVNTCCEGQGTRSLGSIPEFIYSTDPANGDLFVNLFQSSQIQWDFGGQSATLTMHTHFPFENDVNITIGDIASSVSGTIYLRIPSWQTANVTVKMSDGTNLTGQPGTYLPINHTWKQGDIISFNLSPEHTLVNYDGVDQVDGHLRYGLLYGPILMAITGPDEISLSVSGSPDALFQLLQSVEGSPLHYTINSYAGYEMLPYFDVGTETFTSVPVIDVTAS